MRLPGLDGLRALAITAVLYSHVAMLIKPNDALSTSAGTEGVLLFFAISGFLITMLLLREQDAKSIDLKRFYARRAFRILPVAGIYLSIVWLLAQLGSIELKPWETLTAFLFLGNYAPHTWYTGHFWSLAVEEHFYLVWPLVVSRMGRLALVPSISVAVGTLIWRQLDLIPLVVLPIHRTDYRLDSFGVACAIAILWHYRKPAWISSAWALGSGCALWSIAFLLPHTLFSIRLSLKAIAAALIVAHVAAQAIPWRALELPLVRWVGRLSYSLYIWQQIVLSDLLPIHWAGKLSIAIALAVMSYHWIEQPMIRMGRSLMEKPAMLAALRARFHIHDRNDPDWADEYL
jgi:peptidoglycan/LPS O-acetylase OafA/YrhL